MTFATSDPERRGAIRLCSLHDGPGFEAEAGAVRVARGAGDEEGRRPSVGPGIDRRAGSEAEASRRRRMEVSSSDEYCASGFTGPECQLCAAENHYLVDGDECKECAPRGAAVPSVRPSESMAPACGVGEEGPVRGPRGLLSCGRRELAVGSDQRGNKTTLERLRVC